VVATLGELYTFNSDGRPRTFFSLDSFAFDEPPVATIDPAGMSGCSARLRRGRSSPSWQGPRWRCFAGRYPGASLCSLRSLALMASRILGGAAYVSNVDSNLLSTTPNALLTAPCDSFGGIVAVLCSEGEVRLLSYLPIGAKSFAANPNGSVSVILDDGRGTSVLVNLNTPPNAACVLDGLDRSFLPIIRCRPDRTAARWRVWTGLTSHRDARSRSDFPGIAGRTVSPGQRNPGPDPLGHPRRGRLRDSVRNP